MVEVPVEDAPFRAGRAANEEERLSRVDAAFALQAICLLIKVPGPAIRAGAKVVGPTGQYSITREPSRMLGHAWGREDLCDKGFGLNRGGPIGQRQPGGSA